MMVNMNLASGSVPFTAEDFMGTGNREERVRQKQLSDLAVNRINRQLNTMLPATRRPRRGGKPVSEADDPYLPKWAMKNPPRDPAPTPAPEVKS